MAPTSFNIHRIFLLSVLLCLALLTVSTKPARAEEVSLNLTLRSSEQDVLIEVANQGPDEARNVSASLRFNGESFDLRSPELILPGAFILLEKKVDFPKLPGSYPIEVCLSYGGEGEKFSHCQAASFYYRTPALLDFDCPNLNLLFQKNTQVNLGQLPPGRLLVPQEIGLRELGRNHWELNNPYSMSRFVTGVYFIAESEQGQSHLSRICGGTLKLLPEIAGGFVERRSYFAAALALALLLFFIFYTRYLRQGYGKPCNYYSLARSSFSFALVCSLFIFALYCPSLLDTSSGMLGNIVQTKIAEAFYFSNPNYQPFFRYAAWPLLFYLVFINPLVFLKFKPDPGEDKQGELMQYFYLLSRSLLARKLSLFWNAAARTCLLTYLLKAFYVPIFISWTISNIINLFSDSSGLGANFQSIFDYLIRILFFIDVGFFTFGYLIEHPWLKNRIRSVEHTVFGWAICLICYPPFNSLLDVFYAEPFKSFGQIAQSSAELKLAARVLILALWTVFVWASISLGAKCSNLTNRGVVSKGPYRYLRHPAYVSKVLVWWLSFFFLGEMNLTLLLLLSLIYTLRAYTEEKHLSEDEEYLLYKKQVPWVFLPRLF